MARPRDSRVEDALRNASSSLSYQGNGIWSLSIANGAVVPARAHVSDGWLELRADLPSWAPSRHDSLSWLRLNARLDGSVRVAHPLGDRVPHVRTDAYVEHESNLDDRIAFACLELTGALHAVDLWCGDRSLFEPQPLRTSVADVERACVDAGWPLPVSADTGVRLGIETRAGVYAASLESSPAGAERAVVELVDLAARSEVSRRAMAALLLALSGSVRSVKGVVRDRDGATLAALVSSVDGEFDQALDRALSALAVACRISGREVQALGDERLAGDYLALWGAAPEQDSHVTTEEETCLQQL